MSGAPAPAPGSERQQAYDRRFDPAIAEGFLTVEQAVARGNRQAWAERLARRHDLSLQQALKVADNRVALQEALARSRTAGVGQSPAGTVTVSRIAGAVPAAVEPAAHTPNIRRGIKVLAVAVMLAFGIIATVRWADPGERHYQAAKTMVNDFERGKTPSTIDYEAPVYAAALAELDLVPGRSRYAERALAFATELRAKIDAYRRRLQERERAVAQTQQRRAARTAAFIEAQRVRSLEPEPTYEECDE